MTRWIASVVCWLTLSMAQADDGSKGVSEFSSERIKHLVTPLGEGRFQIGNVTFHKAKREVSFPTKVNLRDVLIEYAVVGQKGKLHEALLSTEVSPSHVHIAMLLLGPKDLPLPSTRRRGPKGQPIDVLLKWRQGEQWKQVRLEDWIRLENSQVPIPHGIWVYNGARITNGYFTANTDQSIVAIILDRDALVNNPRAGNENDEIWFPNEAAIPPLGTPVTVTLRLIDDDDVSP